MEEAIDRAAGGGERAALKWAFLGVSPAGARAVLTQGLAAAAARGELGCAAVFDGGGGGGGGDGGGGGGVGEGGGVGGGCSIRLYRSQGGAYDAAQLAAVDRSQDPADPTASKAEDLDGPASIVMCQVLASPAVAAAWERIAPRRKPGAAAVLSALFPVQDVCPQYVLHLERAPSPPPPPPKVGR